MLINKNRKKEVILDIALRCNPKILCNDKIAKALIGKTVSNKIRSYTGKVIEFLDNSQESRGLENILRHLLKANEEKRKNIPQRERKDFGKVSSMVENKDYDGLKKLLEYSIETESFIDRKELRLIESECGVDRDLSELLDEYCYVAKHSLPRSNLYALGQMLNKFAKDVEKSEINL